MLGNFIRKLNPQQGQTNNNSKKTNPQRVINLAKNFTRAVTNTTNAALGMDGVRTAIAKHDVHHGTEFWRHISNHNFDKAQKSLDQMHNPALKTTGQTLLKALKVTAKNPIGKPIVAGIGRTYLATGILLGKPVGARDMSKEIKEYSNAKNKNIQKPEEQGDHEKLVQDQERQFKIATNDIISQLNSLLKNPALSEETKSTIRKSLPIIEHSRTQDDYPLDGGSSCSSRKHKKSKNSKKGKNGKKVTRKHRKSAKKTRKSHKKTKRGTKRKY